MVALNRRWPRQIDGVAIVVGSAAPDVAYVLAGSRWSVWAHGGLGLIVFCVPVSMIFTWLVVRVLAPVVPTHLPFGARSGWDGWSGLGVNRLVVWRMAIWSFVGALTHVAWDVFSHDWGWPAQHLDWYAEPLTDDTIAGRQVTVYRVVQYVSHLVGIVVCLILATRVVRSPSMRERAARSSRRIPTRRTMVTLWTAITSGAVIGAIWTSVSPEGIASDILRIASLTGLGAVIGSAIILRSGGSERSINATFAPDNP